MQEQRLTIRLLKHWNTIRKDSKMPNILKLNHEAIEDIWPSCFIIHVDMHHHVSYKYEYMGSTIAKAYGEDLTSQEVDYRLKKFPGVVMYKKLGEVTSEHRPMEDDGYFVSEDGKLIKYRACFLPFGSEQKGLTHIMVGLSFRVF